MNINAVKLFKGLIYHKRYGKINHSFQNKIFSILIDFEAIENINIAKIFY